MARATITFDKIGYIDGHLTINAPHQELSSSPSSLRPEWRTIEAHVWVSDKWKPLVLQAQEEKRSLQVTYDIGGSEEIIELSIV